METLIRLLDDAEDIVITAALRFRRMMAWQPRERRRAPRFRNTAPKSARLSG
jgi:hypothetical protein